LAIINDSRYSSDLGYWNQIIGTRGFKGTKAVSGRPMFNLLFEEVEHGTNEDEVEFDQSKLDELEA
jgi:hypothetical protein